MTTPRKGAYRSPCAVSVRRASMTDDEWDIDVAESLMGGPAIDYDPDDDLPDPPAVTLYDEPCAVCGTTGACAYDVNGLPLIHADDPFPSGSSA